MMTQQLGKHPAVPVAAMRAVPWQQTWPMAAGLAALFALSWAYLIVLAGAMASMQTPSAWGRFMGLMPMGTWGLSGYWLAFVMWALMMAAMMIPSVVPEVLQQARQPKGRPVRFAAGYLLAWAAFSLAATIAQGLLVSAGLMTVMMTSASALLSGMVLIAAGLYQWTPAKSAYLAHCRGQAGSCGGFRLGATYGACCVGRCWALMAVLFAAGVMNLALVAALSTFVAVEKAAFSGVWIARIAGVLLVVTGIACLASTASSG